MPVSIYLLPPLNCLTMVVLCQCISMNLNVPAYMHLFPVELLDDGGLLDEDGQLFRVPWHLHSICSVDRPQQIDR